MGSSLSIPTGPAGPGLGDMPESCAARILIHLTPPEICSLARLNRAFRGAASGDLVWESKLPSNYPALLDLVPPDARRRIGRCLTSKKDVYGLLSHSVPFDGGTKVVWLDRVSGGVCVSVSASAMSITGIDDRRYWSRIPTEESRFHVVAFLQQIWWFEVDGRVKFPFPTGLYSLLFRLHLGRFVKKLGRRFCNYERTHGWDRKPVRFELSTSDGQQVSRECCLDEPEKDVAHGSSKRGRWIEYHVGDFVVSSTDMVEVRFTLKQIDCTHSKGGLCVDSVSIIPSELRERRNKI